MVINPYFSRKIDAYLTAFATYWLGNTQETD